MPARIFKRIFDIVFSLIVIVFIFSWLCPILAILIRLESKGPIFFIQLRTGKNGSLFKCYKFRSMRVSTAADETPAVRNDGRITRVGAFLRKTSLDELPQFFNVLTGDMSIVGPRPHMVIHSDEFARITYKYTLRHSLKPGITGWAQVNGLRGPIASQEAILQRIDADLW
ncbi:MAG TPA: sugar transferase, partial [Mucilaginibacter sp.]|nr:sugar transferase [Mucilaginibacter sp.]